MIRHFIDKNINISRTNAAANADMHRQFSVDFANSIGYDLNIFCQ